MFVLGEKIVVEAGNIELDDRDKKILKALQEDCQRPKIDLAEETEIPKTTLFNRIQKLEDAGIIRGYRADIDPAKVGKDLEIIIKVRAKYGKNYKQIVGNKLAEIPGVWAVFFVFGDEDFIVHARGKNRAELVSMVEDLTEMEEIERSSSVIVGEVIKLDHRVCI